MSIATLKKKTQHQYHNNSVGYVQFSINGTHRSQGYVGQTSLSRSLPRTIMRGNVACGNGGCCGTYHITPIVVSGIHNFNNPNVVKHSVKGTAGMLATKYRWVLRPEPFSTTKSTDLNNLNTQSIYIANKARVALTDFNHCDKVNYINGVYLKNTPCTTSLVHTTGCANLAGFGNKNYNVANSYSRRVLDTTKPYDVIPCSENVANIDHLCAENDLILPIDPKLNRTPLVGH